MLFLLFTLYQLSFKLMDNKGLNYCKVIGRHIHI